MLSYRNQFKLQPFGSHGLDAPFPIIVGCNKNSYKTFDLSTLLTDVTLKIKNATHYNSKMFFVFIFL